MKPLLVGSILLGASVAAHAQAPVGSRVLTKNEVKGAEWPRFGRVAATESDDQVKALQLLLRNAGFFKTTPDGFFGSGTQSAVKSFQHSKGLKVDGIVAAQTWAKLCPRLKRGDRGDAVRALQTLLNIQSDGTNEVKVDGVFGFSTETLLRTYQKNVEAKEDGIAGAVMWSYLLSPQGDD